MNKILILCQKEDFAQIVQQIEAALELMKFYVGKEGENVLRIKNKYFTTTVELVHTADVDLSQQKADAAILYLQPSALFTAKQKESMIFVAAKVDSEEQEGQWDVEDFLLDYFVEQDELGLIIGQAPFAKYQKDQQCEENDALDVQLLIDAIQDAELRTQVQALLTAFQEMNFENDESGFLNVFTRLEGMKQLIQKASENDKKNAAAATALLLEKQMGTD